MGKALSYSQRRQIITLRQSGKSLRCISRELGISYGTIQQICKRYSATGEEGLIPRYSRCGPKRRDGHDFVYRAVRCLKTWHPNWGAGKIRCEILHARPNLVLPQVRMLQHWFHWNNQVITSRSLTLPQSCWAGTVHEGWQIDAKEAIKVKGYTPHSWLNIVDERSSGVIDARLFPPFKV